MSVAVVFGLAVAAAPAASAAALPAGVTVGAHELVLVGAGDIASCVNDDDLVTARQVTGVLEASDKAWAFTLGDNVYPSGSVAEFQRCYEPTWGAFKRRTIPVVGNHDWRTPNADGFRAMFAGRFTPTSPLYYSVDVDGLDEAGHDVRWHVVVLDSDCDKVDCRAGGAQHQWLVDDLRRSGRTACTVAMFHHPRFSSGPHGDATEMTALWNALDDGGVDLVLSGHDHIYERFEAVTSTGEAAQAGRGIPSIIVGTGGASHYPILQRHDHSVVQEPGAYGVLLLHLGADGYRASFLQADGRVVDAHAGTCRPALIPKKPALARPAAP